MTKRPKAKKDAKGRFLPNRAKAKAGLNRAILSSAWGQVVLFTIYKALRLGKLVITVAPEYSSQECAICAFTAKGNRLSQAEFVCQRCGHTDNADHNAAWVIAKRGIENLLSGDPLTKAHKVTGIFRKLGPERTEVTPGGDRCKTSRAHGLGAEIAEPGNDGGNPGDLRLGLARRWESSLGAISALHRGAGVEVSGTGGYPVHDELLFDLTRDPGQDQNLANAPVRRHGESPGSCALDYESADRGVSPFSPVFLRGPSGDTVCRELG